jgi:hypothetical protein
MQYNGPLSPPWQRTASWRRTRCFTNSSWWLSSSSVSLSISGCPTSRSPCPSCPSYPPSADAHAPKSPSPFPGSSTNRSARPVRRAPMPAPRRQGRHLLSSPSPEGADAPSTPRSTSVRITLAPIMAGSDAATSVRMGPPAASPGANCNVSRAMDISAPFKFQLTVLRQPLVVVGWCFEHDS